MTPQKETMSADTLADRIRERARAKWDEWFKANPPKQKVPELMAAFALSELEDLQRKVVCSFCGTITEYDHTKEHAQADAILAHIETCEKSPVRQLLDATQEIDRLNRMIRVCENAFQLQESFMVEERAGKFNGLQIAKAWLELEKRAEKAEAELSAAEQAAKEMPSHDDIKKVLGNCWKGIQVER